MAKIEVKQSTNSGSLNISSGSSGNATFQKNVLAELKSIRQSLIENKNFVASSNLGSGVFGSRSNGMIGATEANRIQKAQQPTIDLRKSVDTNFNRLFNILGHKPEKKTPEAKSNFNLLKSLFKGLWNVIRHPFKTIGTILKWGFKLITAPFKIVGSLLKWGFKLITSPFKILGNILKWGFRFLFHPLKTIKTLGKLLIRGIRGLRILRWVATLGRILSPIAKIALIVGALTLIYKGLKKFSEWFKGTKLGKWLGYGKEEPGSVKDRLETNQLIQQSSVPVGTLLSQTGNALIKSGAKVAAKSAKNGSMLLGTAAKGLTKTGKFARGLNPAIQLGTGAIEYIAVKKAGDDKAAKRALVGTATGMIGNTLGAAIGQALIPIPGVGAIIGGMAGGLLFDWLGRKASDHQYDKLHPEQRLTTQESIDLATNQLNSLDINNELYITQTKKLNAEADMIQEQNNSFNAEMISLLKSIDTKLNPNDLTSSMSNSYVSESYSDLMGEINRLG